MGLIAHIAFDVAAAIVVAELLGYLLHRLMHSGWISWICAGHMKHHLVLYGPLAKMRPSEQYMDATTGRIAIGNIGLEWIVPSGVILDIALVALHILRVSAIGQAVSMGTILTWSFLMFSYLHDRMHIRNFWMAGAPLFKRWFVQARRLHDIHHHSMNDQGYMDKNFGIGFFVFDRLFGTLTREFSGFNRRGYAAAQLRFGDLVRIDQRSVNTDSRTKLGK
jgi:sterol desaturase/sphingolipid hydroxylase (fatty acid hydroxylase superfamily)